VNVQTLLAERVARALATIGLGDVAPQIARSSRPELGDYQANGVMAAAKAARRNPRELAAAVVATLDLVDIADDVEVAGPGFINIRLSPAFLATSLDDAAPLLAPTPKPQRIVVDYSAPNLAKEMQVHHLRSTIIGDAVVRVCEALGHHVIRQNHVGDWGTQFGMLVTQLDDVGTESDDLKDLERFYQVAKQRFDAEPDFADRARARVVALQSGDPEARAAWQRFITLSLAHCDAVYRRLGVSLTERDLMPESAYNDDLAAIVATLEQEGLITISDGAKCVFLDEFKGRDGQPLPLIVQKSDGGYLYASTDLAAVRHRCHRLHADRVLYFVDARQSLHFQQVFAVARLAGFASEHCALVHCPFGVMLGKGGRPFKTREGGGVKLTDLLDEAESRAFALVSEKNAALPEDERRRVAHAVGIGAVKYADLSKNRTSDYVFDWDQMLAFDGNTAPYLQYAFTRVQSLFRRDAIDAASLTGRPTITAPAERALAVTLLRFQETAEQVAADAFPHVLCNYLMDLAAAYMQFYEQCPVLTAAPDVRQSRLLICKRVAATLRHGLDLLGIEVVERM
jgi:arginyl-tRNA synthetase